MNYPHGERPGIGRNGRARVDEVRRFAIYGTSGGPGETLAVGCEFPDGHIFAAPAIADEPSEFDGVESLRTLLDCVHDEHLDVFVEWVDPIP